MIKRNQHAAPRRQTVLTFASPRVQDILFFETEDCTDGNFGRYGRAIPAYGTKHYDQETWPNHELVFAQPLGPDGLVMKFFYAARRENQDDYNYELRDGLELVRTYVIKRSEYPDLLPVPAGGTPDDLFPDYGFAGDSVTSLQEPLSSLYIAVQRRFIEKLVSEQVYEASIETHVTVTKELKPSGYTLEDDSLVSGVGVVYEVRHGNAFHEILVTRTLTEAQLEDRTLPMLTGAQKYEALPPRLDSVDMTYRSAWVERTNADGDKSGSFSEDFFLDFNITPPLAGPFKTEIHRVITADPEPVVDAILAAAVQLPPLKQEDVSVAYAAWSTNPPSARAVARQYRVPTTYHGSVPITINGVNGGSSRTNLTLNRVISPSPIPANPTGFSGDLVGTYLIDVEVSKVALEMSLVTYVNLVLDGIYS